MNDLWQWTTDDSFFPSPVKPKVHTSNSDAVHANCIFKLKIRGLDLDGSIQILGMSVCQFPIWHRCLARGGVRTEGQRRVGGAASKPDRKQPWTAWPAQLPWVPFGRLGLAESGRPPPLPPRAHAGRVQLPQGRPRQTGKAPIRRAWLPLRAR